MRSLPQLKHDFWQFLLNMVIIAILFGMLIMTSGCSVNNLGNGGFTDMWVNAFNQSPSRDYVETRLFIRRSIDALESSDD